MSRQLRGERMEERGETKVRPRTSAASHSSLPLHLLNACSSALHLFWAWLTEEKKRCPQAWYSFQMVLQSSAPDHLRCC